MCNNAVKVEHKVRERKTEREKKKKKKYNSFVGKEEKDCNNNNNNKQRSIKALSLELTKMVIFAVLKFFSS